MINANTMTMILDSTEKVTVQHIMNNAINHVRYSLIDMKVGFFVEKEKLLWRTKRYF